MSRNGVALAPFTKTIKCSFMYQVLLYLHSFLRWVILLLSLIVLVRSYVGMTKAAAFTAGDKKAGLFLMIDADTTLLVGLILYCIGPWGVASIRNLGFGEVIKDKVYRFYAVEHIFGMLVAIMLITLARGGSKKLIGDVNKHKRIFWFILLALVIMLATIPWPFRAGIGRPWF